MGTLRTIAPPTPGSVLKTHLRRPGNERITQDVLADALCVSRLTVNQIVNGRRAISPDMAVRLSRVFGTSAELWSKLQMRFDLHEAQRRLDASSPTLKVLREAA